MPAFESGGALAVPRDRVVSKAFSNLQQVTASSWSYLQELVGGVRITTENGLQWSTDNRKTAQTVPVYMGSVVFLLISDIGGESMTDLILQHEDRSSIPQTVLR